MALVDLFAVSKQYDNKKLLDQVDFHLHEGDRVAIIGQNGCGKSTLMHIVYGKLEIDSGKRVSSNETQIEMLAQVPKFAKNLTVRQAVEHELRSLKEAKVRYDELSSLLVDDFTNKQLLKEHDELSKFLDHYHAWSLDHKIEQALNQFRLKELETKDIHDLSGGEQRRVALASLILKKPDVLILDEPTNHLDVQMVEYLETMIMAEGFTILFVSHDRYFIDNISTQIVEIESFGLKKYKGGYQDFLAQKENYLLSLEKQQHNLERELHSEMQWLNRGVKARTKRNVGRVRRVHDLKNKVNDSPLAIRKMRQELMREKNTFMTPGKTNSKKIYFDIYNLCYQVDGRLLIDRFKTKILQRDRIAIVGPNGCGKSTLLKLLTGQLQPKSGTIKKAEFVIGYFDQQRGELNEEKDLIQTFCPAGGDRVEVQGKNLHVYGYLKSFNFPPEDLTKKISMLSGGERSRVALALLFTKKIDCLILDEPTNDLDIQTINILEEKINDFSGVVIFVSHDRYFVDKIAEKLFLFEENGRISETYQKYTDYLELEKAIHEAEVLEKTVQIETQIEKKAVKNNSKLSFKDKHALDTLPDQIVDLEKTVSLINQQLVDHASDSKKVIDLASELGKIQAELVEKEDFYLSLLEKEESLLSKNNEVI